MSDTKTRPDAARTEPKQKSPRRNCQLADLSEKASGIITRLDEIDREARGLDAGTVEERRLREEAAGLHASLEAVEGWAMQLVPASPDGALFSLYQIESQVNFIGEIVHEKNADDNRFQRAEILTQGMIFGLRRYLLEAGGSESRALKYYLDGDLDPRLKFPRREDSSGDALGEADVAVDAVEFALAPAPDADRLLGLLGAPGLGDDAAGLVAVHRAMHAAAASLQAALDGPLAGDSQARLSDEPAARFVHEVQMLIDQLGDAATDRLEGLPVSDGIAAKHRAQILISQAIAFDDLDAATALIEGLRKGAG